MRGIIKNKKFHSIFIVSFLFLFLFTFWAGAQSVECIADCNECNPAGCTARSDRCVWDGNEDKCCRKLEIDWPKSPMGTQINGCTSLPMMIKYFYEWGVLLGGLAVFVALIIAGFQYLTSIGDPRKMAEARSQIVSAILGLVLILSSWLILNTINPALTTFRNITFNPQDIGDVAGKFTGGETEPCDWAWLYKKKNYDAGDGRHTIPHFGKYVIEQHYRSVKCFVQCDLCSDEEIVEDEDLSDEEKKCIKVVKIDGSSVYYIKDGFDECEQHQLYNYGVAGACTEFDCEAYYKEGGACTLQLSSEKAWWDVLGDFCSERIGETYAKHPNLDSLTDVRIACVQLIKHEPKKFE